MLNGGGKKSYGIAESKSENKKEKEEFWLNCRKEMFEKSHTASKKSVFRVN